MKIFSFAFVHYSGNTIYRKLSALLLIALLLFVNAVKLLHSHSTPPGNQKNLTVIKIPDSQINATKSEPYYLQNCSICNFHLIKDLDHIVLSYSIAAISVTAVHGESTTQNLNTSAIWRCSNKGPPGLV